MRPDAERWQDRSKTRRIRRVIDVTEPQIWTALGILAAAFVGLITVVTQQFTRALALQHEAVLATLEGLRVEMRLRFERVDERFAQVDQRFERVDERFAQVDARFAQVDRRFERLEDHLRGLDARVEGVDRDVQAIAKRVFPE